ncbi:MAG TPA: FapA family protein, partial [Deltaproteobacteria bacterium]|nr:FapA family protein [Deltaproteobacteria bacterium]
MEIHITEGGLVASMRITPTAGEIFSVSAEDLLEHVRAEGITIGVLTEVIERMAQNRITGEWVVIARGVKPEEGTNGSVRFHFDKDRIKARIQEDATGKVNLRDLNLIQNVKKGDLLCELIPPRAGKSGMSVKGEELPSKEGAHAKLPEAKNVTISADRTHMYAAMDGLVQWVDNAVQVDAVYTVHDVDASVGNIRFNGSVVVQGEVGDG